MGLENIMRNKKFGLPLMGLENTNFIIFSIINYLYIIVRWKEVTL